jgi:hypothetical protein
MDILLLARSQLYLYLYYYIQNCSGDVSSLLLSSEKDFSLLEVAIQGK